MILCHVDRSVTFIFSLSPELISNFINRSFTKKSVLFIDILKGDTALGNFMKGFTLL